MLSSLPKMPRQVGFRRAAKHVQASARSTLTGISARFEALTQFVQALRTLRSSEFVFDVRDPDARLQLIKLLWQPELYARATHGNQAASNPELAAILRDATSNEYIERQHDNEALHYRRAGLLEGIFSTVVRMRSKFLMPFLVVLMSVVATMTHAPTYFVELLRMFYRGAIADDQWTLKLIDDALEHNPGPPYPVLKGVGACMLDNLSIQVDRHGVFTTNAHGRLQHMTLWQEMAIPASMAPPGFDAESIGACTRACHVRYSTGAIAVDACVTRCAFRFDRLSVR